METTKISVDVLKVHPRNEEFFDDISGEEYQRFKESIKEDGIIQELIVAPDMTIISGHQRCKAARELGIKMVPVRIREDLDTEDKKLKVLLAANFGRLKNDEGKQRKVAAEYVKLRGFKNGGHREAQRQVGTVLTLDEIAVELGTSKRNLQRMIRIENSLTEEMKGFLDDGVISKTIASDLVAALSPEEQEELISSLDATKKVTKVQMQKYIDEIKRLKENPVMPADYERTKTALEDYKGKANKYKEEVAELKDKLEIAENYKADEEEKLKKLESMYENRIAALECDKQMLKDQMETDQKKVEKFDKLNDEINFLTKQKTDLARQIKSATELAELTVTIQSVLEKDLAPIKFKRCIDDLDKNEVAVKNLIEVIKHVETWLEEINNIVGDYRHNNDVIDADYEVYDDNDNNDEYNEFEEYRDFFDQSIPTRSDGKPMTVFDDPKFMKMYNKNKDIIDGIDINDLFKED